MPPGGARTNESEIPKNVGNSVTRGRLLARALLFCSFSSRNTPRLFVCACACVKGWISEVFRNSAVSRDPLYEDSYSLSLSPRATLWRPCRCVCLENFEAAFVRYEQIRGCEEEEREWKRMAQWQFWWMRSRSHERKRCSELHFFCYDYS